MLDKKKELNIYHQTINNFVVYWSDFVVRFHSSYEKLEVETSNIFKSLQNAIDFKLFANFTTSVHYIYPFCESKGYFFQAEKFISTIHDLKIFDSQEEEAQNYLFFGRIKMRQERFEEAVYFWEKGLKIAEHQQFRTLQCLFKKELGLVSFEKREYAVARKCFVEALQNNRPVKDKILKCKIEGELCKLYFHTGEKRKSRFYCRIAIKNAFKQENNDLISALLLFRGLLEDDDGEPTKAISTWTDGLVFAREFGNLERILYFLANLGEAANMIGMKDDAEKYLVEGIEVARKLGNTQVLSYQLMDLGLLYGNQTNYSKAKAAFTEGIELAKQTKYLPLISYNLLKAGNFFLSNSLFQDAFSMFEECVKSISPEESVEKYQIRRAEAQFKAAKAAQKLSKIEQAKDLCEKAAIYFGKVDQAKESEILIWINENLPD